MWEPFWNLPWLVARVRWLIFSIRSSTGKRVAKLLSTAGWGSIPFPVTIQTHYQRYCRLPAWVVELVDTLSWGGSGQCSCRFDSGPWHQKKSKEKYRFDLTPFTSSCIIVSEEWGKGSCSKPQRENDDETIWNEKSKDQSKSHQQSNPTRTCLRWCRNQL